MEKLSKLLGKPVINIFDGILEGYVKNVLLDEKLQKVVWIEIFDDENQEEKLVDAKSIFYTNQDAIMIKNGEHIFLADTMVQKETNPIGFKVYLINGKYVDKIIDAEIDDKLKVKNIILKNEKTLDKKAILSIGKNVIVQKTNKNIKLSTFAPNKVKIDDKTNSFVEILNNQPKPQIQMPKKVLTTSYEFLIGRKVGKNLYAENGQLIAKKQSKITSHIIDTASQNGKLKELTTFSLT